MAKVLFTSLLAVAFAWPVLAQQKNDDHAVHRDAASASAAADLTEGEIRKLDKISGTITIKHGEIKNLGMPPMTMVFKAKNAALLDKVKVGDRIRFTAEQTKAGTLIVTDVQPAALKP
jgi:Cu(I)/Ag(I) efflux system protein CusF